MKKKTFKEWINENFISVDNVKSDKDILRLSIIAEQDATNLYEVLATKTSNPKLKRVLLDVANEEKVHVGEFQGLLKEIDDEYEDALIDGENEIDEI